jgi:hypothetical protein
MLTSGYDAELPGHDGSELKVLCKPYCQADLVRALREALDA